MTLTFIGHSIVYGYPYGNALSFPAFAGELLGEEYNIVNLGVNGESSEEIFRRFERYISAEAPDMIFLMAGSNDFIFRLNGVEEAMEYCRRARSLAEEKGVRFVHISPPPLNPVQASQSWADTGVEMYNLALKDLEKFADLLTEDAKLSGCGYIDVFSEYQKINNYLDGVHPTTEGQLFIGKLCAEWIKANI